ncbi:MAG: N-acetylmuramic acid 6-phosphate etherase [Candidatus Marinimicrobia bacterium]|nr:N-acetylmuramic acid 6-phosphate etherase [Candidatus Neomarinimicrobiota bacterium]
MERQKTEVDSSFMATLTTEQRNPNSMEVDALSVREILELINNEDKLVAEAVNKEIDNIELAVNYVVEALREGGRLIYAGAGTSGRLGILDATEIPPTFSADPNMVQGIIAGGMDALVRSIEGAEDYPDNGKKDIMEKNVTDKDVVFGIATSGRTPYVLGALEKSKELGAKTIFLSCNKVDETGIYADLIISPIVGPEVVTGSTRMKAGTATKLVLNMVTTTAMIKLGKVYGNLMVDLRAVNNKLVDRACRILNTVTGIELDAAKKLLTEAENNLKVAIVMQLGELDREQAISKLDEVNGVVRNAVDLS